jgi:hypothetical protein
MENAIKIEQIKSDTSPVKIEVKTPVAQAVDAPALPGKDFRDNAVEITLTGAESITNKAVPRYTAEKELKLFTGGSLPLKGLFEIQMIDENGDGRVDAGDAISRYLEMTRQPGIDARKADKATA